MPGKGAYRLDIAAIRAEADRISGERPRSIQVEVISHSAVPRIAMVSGTDWSRIDMVRVSYRLVFPKGSIIIDTGFDASTAKQGKVDSFDDVAFRRVLAAMDRATHIVVTHEHADHIGGLLTSLNLVRILPKSILNPQQFEESDRIKPLHWPAGSRAGYRPIAYDRLLAIAPGVVLIRAPGHTPGSQMVYVRRADGQEYLFMGDTASAADNVRLEHIRSRLVTDFISHDDRPAVLLQTRALHQLAIAGPAVALVPGHDGPAIEALERRGLLTRGFRD
jgi:glyoxylase-like metal-dependent hydrolase (beta-lactamase superfamily II)